MLTVVIPSKTEKFLQKTILDVLEKATGEIEILPILDGYEPPEEELVKDSRVRYIRLEAKPYSQKRHGINLAVSQAKGEYVMSLDAHCMMAKGFDTQLAKDHKRNWVQIPRRHRLDAEKWALQPQSDKRPPIDYEYIMWPLQFNPIALHGFKWDDRTIAREKFLIDDTIQFQGSCWFMAKKWFEKMGFMQIEGYTGWGQEAEEISLTTWKNGGRVVTNKNTWYAHLHKGQAYGRMYHLSREENHRSYNYSYNKWVTENKDFFIELIEKFAPLPGWPTDWKNQLWPNTAIIENSNKQNTMPKASTKKNSASIVYLTSNIENIKFEHIIRKELEKNSSGLPIVCVSRKPTRFGKKNINVGEVPISESTFLKQLLLGLQSVKTDYVFLAKDTCVYPPEYFTFVPPTDDHIYRYTNMWVLGDKYWFTDHCEFAQAGNRKYWIKLIKSALNDQKAWEPVPARLSLDTSPDTIWTSENPVVRFQSTSGKGGFPSVKRNTRPQRQLPFWGSGNDLNTKMGLV